MLQCCLRHTLIMGLRRLPWPLNASNSGHTCARHGVLASSRLPTARMLHDQSRQCAYSEKSDNRRGDEYGPLWPPMLSEPANEDLDAGLVLPPCLELLPEGPGGSSSAREPCLCSACSRPLSPGRPQHGICLQIWTMNCRLRGLSSLSGDLCSQAAGDWQASQPKLSHKHHRAIHIWTGARTLTLVCLECHSATVSCGQGIKFSGECSCCHA